MLEDGGPFHLFSALRAACSVIIIVDKRILNVNVCLAGPTQETLFIIRVPSCLYTFGHPNI